jgi:thymidylate synthase
MEQTYLEYQEQAYLDLLKKVLETGEEKIDRTGVGTKSLFGTSLKFDLSEKFPMLTTKRIFVKPVFGELLWFLEGSGDERRLAEITYGTRDKERTTIWTANAEASYWKPKAAYEGDLGRVYGVQWRKWRTTKLSSIGDIVHHIDGGYTVFDTKATVTELDQIAQVINSLKNNPADRRMMITAFNPGEIDQMALPPCHMFAQFHVNQQTKKLNCQMYMRSVDLFLGLPFNIASYALLTKMLAHVTGLTAGELTIAMGDTHIYLNHLEQVKEQLSRTPYEMPTVTLDESITNIDDFKMEHIKLNDYQYHPAIKAPMAV